MPQINHRPADKILLTSHENQETLFRTLDAAGQGVLLQSSDGSILAANPTAQNLLALAEKDLIGKRLGDLAWNWFSSDGTPLLPEQHPVSLSLRSGKPVTGAVIALSLPASPKKHWLNLTVLPEFNPGQSKPTQVITILQDITAARQTEYLLGERKKELQAFYAMTDLAEVEGISLEQFYQRVIDLLPPSWQYSDLACGRISVHGQHYTTRNYQETPWRQSASLRLNGAEIGTIEIAYLAECPPEDEGPFLKEERLLLNSIAERIGRIIERRQTAESLQQNNDFLGLALRATNLGTWQQDFSNGKIHLDEIARLYLGFDQTALSMQDLRKQVHAQNLADFQSVFENPSAGQAQAEFRIFHPDGTLKWLQVNALIHFSQGAASPTPVSSVGTIQNITERKTADAALHRKTRALIVLSSFNQALVRLSDEAELLNSLCKICVEDGHYRMAWVGYPEDSPQKTILPVAEYGFEDGYLQSANITWADTPRGRGPTGTAVREQRPVIAQDIQNDPRLLPWREAAIQRGYAACIGLPLITDGSVLGVLTIYSREPDAFQEDEVSMLVQLSNDLAYGIEAIRSKNKRARLEEDLRKSEGRYKLAQQAAHIGSWEWNLKSDTLYWSDEMYILFDKDPQRFSPSQSTMLACILPQDQAAVSLAYAHAADQGEPFEIEFRILDASGKVKWLNSKGNILRNGTTLAAGTMQDITQRREIEEALRLAPKVVPVLFNAAIVYEQTGQRAKALEAVGRALQAGASRVGVENQPDLNGLRDDPRYVSLLAEAGKVNPQPK